MECGRDGDVELHEAAIGMWVCVLVLVVVVVLV